MLAICGLLKPRPVMVIGVPTGPELGDNPVISGAIAREAQAVMPLTVTVSGRFDIAYAVVGTGTTI